ncbi:MAG: DUF1707 domain-containing protein [Microbacteriaceae bacterium]
MIDFTDPTTAHQRLSNTERDGAVAALIEYAADGRLTETEAAERSATARTAVTRGDLAPLFSDLPAPMTHSNPPATGAASDASFGDGRGAPFGAWNRASSGRIWGRAIVSLMPFLALALFFITGNTVGYSFAWLWFMLIPVAGIVVYGAGGFDRPYRDR